ncbi:MAG: hypothetical protein JWM53_2330, partial [bacterium]|nr:hypothetical protein [bacterium]
IEPEAILDGGVAILDGDWGRDGARWLQRLFPQPIDGIPMSEALWVNLFRKGDLVRRQVQLVYTRNALEGLRPARVVVVGIPPDPMGHFADEAVRRGVLEGESVATRWRRRAHAASRPARLGAFFCRYAASALVRAVINVRNRRHMDQRLAALSLPDEAPTLWLGVSATYRQTLRQIRTLARALDLAGVPYGVLFEQAYGLPRGVGDLDVDEVAVLDGSVERLQARAVAQVVGASRWSELAPVVARWLRSTLPSAVAVARTWGDFTVGGLPVLRERDASDLMRVVTGDLYRTLDAAAAARRWTARNSQARVVAWAISSFGETKAPDLVAQSAGLTTVDLMHGYVSEGCLQSSWRTCSTYNLSWTLEQAKWMARLGTNRYQLGGFAPLTTQLHLPRGPRPRVLVLSSYVQDPFFPCIIKYARRLAQALAPWIRRLGDTIEVRARLHPLDDGSQWESYFAPSPAPMRTVGTSLAEDLAWADLVIATPSSAAIDALLRGVPVLVHRGPVLEPETLFAHWPRERTFASADELMKKASPLLKEQPDLEPESTLLRRCFGPGQRPRALDSFLVELLNGPAHSEQTRLESNAK